MSYNKGYSVRTPEKTSEGKWEEADGFVNMYLPDQKGEYFQAGAIALRKTDKNTAQLFDQLLEDPERVVKLLKILKLSFKPNRRKMDTGPVIFDLDSL